MYRILPLFFLCFALETFAQKIEFLASDWQNPAVFEKGQNLAHAFHIPYSTGEAALQALPEKCENYQLLNGQWKFKWVDTPAQVPADFSKPDFEVNEWEEIKVPANWQMEGYGHAKFRNIALSFENDPPHIPDYYNPVGCYKRKINIPKGWNNKEIMLRFEGVKSGAYIWVNGEKVGYNQGGFEPAEFNITAFVNEGENDLAVEVLRFTDGSYLENQDMWRLSGIYRDVKLYAQPKTFIHDLYVVTDFDKDYKDASLTVEMAIQNRLQEAVAGSVEIDVFTNEGISILKDGAQSIRFNADSAAMETLSLSTLVGDAPKWSAEFPNLFILLVQLKNADGKMEEAFAKKIGFREVEYTNEILTVNGVAIKLNGVNSHMHHPEHGQAVPFETLKHDLVLMKQHNINCVRTCHYPPTPEYLQLADELGMYIIDEVGDEAHSNLQLSEKEQWTEMYRDRSRKLVHRDRNHPSVIMWSAGNESGSGFNINEVIKTGKEIDPSRPAWMYGGNTFFIPFEDIVGPRYWLPIDYKNLAEGKVLPKHDLRASFMDEYLAATGNGLGGMDEYWELIWKHQRLLGGAIWDWISPGVATPRWVLPDLSDAKNNGQIMGRPVLTEGKQNWGLEFSGHDDWVEFYRDPSLDITGNELSIGFWVKPMEIPQANVFLAKGKHGYGIQMENAQTLEFYIYGEKRISAKAKVGSDFYNEWHYVAGIYDGRQLQLYIDGKQVARTPFSGNISSTPFALCLGREAETQDQGEYAGRMSKMVMDEVKVFNKAVNSTAIEEQTENAVLYLDFEENKKNGEFYAVGLGGRTYGIVWPNRKVQPEIHQIKKSGQPVNIEAIDLDKGLLKVSNRHHFKNLIELSGLWQILVDGEAVQSGSFESDVAAGESDEVNLAYRRPRIDSKAECVLQVSFVVRHHLSWATKGHEIAWEQFPMPSDTSIFDEVQNTGSVKATDNETQIVISGDCFEYIIDKNTGRFKSLKYKEVEYLKNGPTFNVWRAPLANDIDPWGNYMFSDNNRTAGKGRSVDNQLRTLGMRNFTVQVDAIQVQQLGRDKLSVEIKAFSNSSNLVQQKTYGHFPAFERNEKWTILANGTIELEQEIIPHGTMPDMLPKIGLQFQLPKAFCNVEYYGRGPFENYPDRKTGAKLGRYTSTVDSMFVPYIMPQDYGNRCDVHWCKIQNEEKKGLLIKSDEPLNFSLHKYSTDNLSRAMYSYQLKESASTILNVDYEVSGLGGTAIRQLQKYRVRPHVGKYTLTIQPF